VVDLLGYLWVIWLIGIPIYLRLLFSIIKNRGALVNSDTRCDIHSPFIIFQITTKGGQKIVLDNVNKINEVCSKIGYKNFRIDVISEIIEKFKGANVITIPKDFTPLHAKFKARALQYAIQFREKSNENTASYWIFHLDDESMLTAQCLISLMKHIEGKGNPISEGLIIYPNKWNEGSKLVKYLDSIRPVFCYECMNMLSQRSGFPDWLHGSNLLVRADIEKSIGWDFDTISEDSLFGYKAFKKYGKTIFGWHGGMLKEQSPFTFKDFVKQRKRWISGTIMNLRYQTTKEKALVLYRLSSWAIGFFSFFVMILSFLVKQQVIYFLQPLLAFNYILLLAIYQIGFQMNTSELKFSMKKRIMEHVIVGILTPLLLFLESIPIWAWIRHHSNEFEIIMK